MQTQLCKALIPADIRSLLTFDHKVFPRSDWFDREDWEHYESWWMIVENRRVGCCAFEFNKDFRHDLPDGGSEKFPGSLYIASTGILPARQGQGFGTLLKAWQIAYARRRHFTRIVTNTRKSNRAMMRLNQRFGFKAIRTTPNYYRDPLESTIVMELVLKAKSR